MPKPNKAVALRRVSGPAKEARKPVSASLQAEAYRMVRVLAALEDTTIGGIVEDAVMHYLNSRKGDLIRKS